MADNLHSNSVSLLRQILPDREGVALRLGNLAGRVRRLRPCHRDPERFHLEKSEIETELRRLSLKLRQGGA
jgi:hypothetical protein